MPAGQAREEKALAEKVTALEKQAHVLAQQLHNKVCSFSLAQPSRDCFPRCIVCPAQLKCACCGVHVPHELVHTKLLPFGTSAVVQRSSGERCWCSTHSKLATGEAFASCVWKWTAPKPSSLLRCRCLTWTVTSSSQGWLTRRTCPGMVVLPILQLPLPFRSSADWYVRSKSSHTKPTSLRVGCHAWCMDM